MCLPPLSAGTIVREAGSGAQVGRSHGRSYVTPARQGSRLILPGPGAGVGSPGAWETDLVSLPEGLTHTTYRWEGTVCCWGPSGCLARRP